MTDTDMLHGARLSEAIADLKSSTRVTMETVGIRCQRRVSTATYKQGLPKLKGQRRLSRGPGQRAHTRTPSCAPLAHPSETRDLGPARAHECDQRRRGWLARRRTVDSCPRPRPARWPR